MVLLLHSVGCEGPTREAKPGKGPHPASDRHPENHPAAGWRPRRPPPGKPDGWWPGWRPLPGGGRGRRSGLRMQPQLPGLTWTTRVKESMTTGLRSQGCAAPKCRGQEERSSASRAQSSSLGRRLRAAARSRERPRRPGGSEGGRPRLAALLAAFSRDQPFTAARREMSAAPQTAGRDTLLTLERPPKHVEGVESVSQCCEGPWRNGGRGKNVINSSESRSAASTSRQGFRGARPRRPRS